MQEACKQIQQVSSWEEYFARIGVPTPSKEELIEWYPSSADVQLSLTHFSTPHFRLRRSVANSERKGYHDPRKFRRFLGEKYALITLSGKRY